MKIGWEGVRDATEHTVVCPQTGFLFGSNEDDEDCLSINVYSPNLTRQSPVMVWIYGGGFSKVKFKFDLLSLLSIILNR